MGCSDSSEFLLRASEIFTGSSLENVRTVLTLLFVIKSLVRFFFVAGKSCLRVGNSRIRTSRDEGKSFIEHISIVPGDKMCAVKSYEQTPSFVRVSRPKKCHFHLRSKDNLPGIALSWLVWNNHPCIHPVLPKHQRFGKRLARWATCRECATMIECCSSHWSLWRERKQHLGHYCFDKEDFTVWNPKALVGFFKEIDLENKPNF